ncbi:MAG: TetR/AcrR family transcriptional regulator, partial [Xanthobacteraceae bacterium]
SFAARALRHRRLAFAAVAEPVDAAVDPIRLKFRKLLADEFAMRIAAAIASGHLPEQDAMLAAVGVLGLLVEGTIGPLAPQSPGRELVQSLALTALRALGLADPRARGLVVQTVIKD